jgi:hypothetical protein
VDLGGDNIGVGVGVGEIVLVSVSVLVLVSVTGRRRDSAGVRVDDNEWIWVVITTDDRR